MEFTRAQDKPRSGVTHCRRAINTCCASQSGMRLALTFCNEVSFLLQWEMVARLATAWQQPLCSPVRARQAAELSMVLGRAGRHWLQ